MSQATHTPSVTTIESGHWNYENAVRFNRIYDSINQIIKFDPSWHNGTGYFDAVVKDKGLKETLQPGEMAKCMSDDGRKMIIIGTSVVPVVAFQRDTDDLRHCFNGPIMFKRLGILAGTGETIRDGLMDQLFGYNDEYNVGKRIVDIAKLLSGEIHHSGRKLASLMLDNVDEQP